MDDQQAVGTLAALAHDTRLRVYRALAVAGPGGRTAGELTSALGISKTTMSNHLAVLARAGVVSQERAGRVMIYRAQPERVAALARLLAMG